VPFESKDRARELGRLGGHAKAAKVRAASAPPTPFAGTILDAMVAAGLVGPSWSAWVTFWKVVFALPMDADELERFTRHTGRATPPAAPVREAWPVVGRRGGKSRNFALAALFLGVRQDYGAILAPGERAIVPVIAADRQQARVVLSYLKGLCQLPTFACYLKRTLKESVELTTGAIIAVHSASYRSTRGFTLAGVVADEVAFWRSDETGANPDAEILGALRPGMATIPGALLLGGSTPYAAAGELYKAIGRYFGTDDASGISWNADTASMNPNIDPKVIADAFEADPIAAASEYGRDGSVSFRHDVEAFLDAEVVRSATVPGRHELPPAAGITYVAFADPSGGSQDAFTLGIAHLENGRAVLDVLRERRPPFSPDAVVQEYAELLKTYRLSRVAGDRYGGAWPAERFQVHGIRYTPAEKVKSDLYRELLPLMNAGRADLLDLQRLRAQLVGLERRVARGGKDSIDHTAGGHDDLANAAAGALVLAGGRGKKSNLTLWTNESLRSARIAREMANQESEATT
jgi:hypothetical protein